MAQEPENLRCGGLSPADGSAPTAPTAIRWWLCGACVLLVVIAVILPTSALSWLRSDYQIIGVPLLWLDNASESFALDLTHVALFGLVALVMATLWPRTHWWRIGSALLMLAVGSELLQLLVPGREPRVGDVVDDLIGAAIGCLLSLPLRWWLTRR